MLTMLLTLNVHAVYGSDVRIVTIVIVLYLCFRWYTLGIFGVMFHPRILCMYTYHLPLQGEECMVLDRCGGIMALHKLSVSL